MTGNDNESAPGSLADSLLELDRVVRRLRQDCPWDREQDVVDIVTYTLEETYELIDAAHAGRGSEVTGEVGDLLYHAFFLALLAEEKGWGDLAGIAGAIVEKLVRRHPHVFGDAVAETASEVVERWDHIKRTGEGREGIFHDVPGSLPSLLYTKRMQARAGSVGFDWDSTGPIFAKLDEEIEELHAALGKEAEGPPGGLRGPDTAVYHEIGDILFAAVNLARKLKVDPELALRSASARFQERVERAAALAAAAGEDFGSLPLESQEEYYQQAKSES